MNIKDNRRVSMTKKILKDTFIEMLEEKDIQKIYVRELCERADINRSTFYKYYDSQYTLLTEMEEDLLNQIEEKCNNKDSDLDGLITILTFLKNNKKVYKLLFNSTTDPLFAKKILNLPIILKSVSEKLSNTNEYKYKQTYILQGGYHVILEWLNNNCKETPKEIANILMKYIKQNLDK